MQGGGTGVSRGKSGLVLTIHVSHTPIIGVGKRRCLLWHGPLLWCIQQATTWRGVDRHLYCLLSCMQSFWCVPVAAQQQRPVQPAHAYVSLRIPRRPTHLIALQQREAPLFVRLLRNSPTPRLRQRALSLSDRDSTQVAHRQSLAHTPEMISLPYVTSPPR